MGLVEDSPKERRIWIAFIVAGLIAGLVLRFRLASFARMPGHGDSAFYYTVAKNIVDGRGPVIDYIVYFFEGLLPEAAQRDAVAKALGISSGNEFKLPVKAGRFVAAKSPT